VIYFEALKSGGGGGRWLYLMGGCIWGTGGWHRGVSMEHRQVIGVSFYGDGEDQGSIWDPEDYFLVNFRGFLAVTV
jgi:hypothetical protein